MDLFAQRWHFSLFRAAIAHRKNARSTVQFVIPTRVNRRAKIDIPGSVKSSPAARHVSVSGEGNGGFGFMGAFGDEIADADVAAHSCPVRGSLFGSVGGAYQELRDAQLIGTDAEVIR